MASKIFNLKVVSIDRNTMIATLIDTEEIDDVVKYEILIPAHFGGHTNPWPKIGESLKIRYGKSWGRVLDGEKILECWREREEVAV